MNTTRTAASHSKALGALSKVTDQNTIAVTMRFVALTLFALQSVFTTNARAVNIDWLPVGNAGNAPDTVVMTTDGTSGYGSVDHNYRIAKYDVTVRQYVEFLNAKDATGANALGLYNSQMSDATFGYGGISFIAGNASGTKYGIIPGHENHPANYISWFDAIRFANWLNNGQGSGDTESGAYTLLGNTPTPNNWFNITRSAGATVFLPSENEWYKAAYYSPGTNSYFKYPTSSNLLPTATGPTATPNSANYNLAVGKLTDVGAYSGTTSPYGAFDMGGNVFQWNEAFIIDNFGFHQLFRGSSWGNGGGVMDAEYRFIGFAPHETFSSIGIRLASIPEPSSIVLLTIGTIGLAVAAVRRRMRK